jgi:hypothetical protein
MFRVWGPDTDPQRPIFLCPKHYGILRRNLVRLAADRSLDPDLPDEFEPAEVKWEEVTGKFQCRMEFDPDAVPCGPELGEV